MRVVDPPAVEQRERQVVLRAKWLAQLEWCIDRNHLDGSPPSDEGATDADVAARFAVRNLCAAIRDLGET